MLVATWNVNSLPARIERVIPFLERCGPDILCIQELKCDTPKFPEALLRDAGYHSVAIGQPTYNGVAILSKSPIELLHTAFADGTADTQARFIMGRTAGIDVISAYVPNGQEVGSDKYLYKLAWLSRLRRFLDKHTRASDPMILAGDFNIAPTDLDCHDPAAWRGKILFSELEKSGFKKLMEFGFQDTFRLLNPEIQAFSWWDYRELAFPKNRGMRIDFVLCTEKLAAKCKKSWIERQERKGLKPSDHAPVFAEFD